MKKFIDLSESEQKKLYDDYIDEICDEVRILSAVFYASDVLKKLDPLMYEEGFSEFCGNKECNEEEE